MTRSYREVVTMSQDIGDYKNKVYKVVLTGGPCGGKTTGQARLSAFFESLGWQVYRSPETALVLMSGGIKFTNLKNDEPYRFQENLIKTMMQIENTYFELARTCQQNCLVICDRGLMDATAYLPKDQWVKMKTENQWNEVDLRDNRYNQIIHMVSAANGAEPFYTIEGHDTRHEDLSTARNLDEITAQAWVGHPYYDVIDNATGFEEKVMKMISAVCNRLGIDAGDRLSINSKKRKFLVKNLADLKNFPAYQQFIVVHDYLVTPSRKMQARIRRRGQNGFWTFTHTIRRPEINKQSVELRMAITQRDYKILMAQKDDRHHSIFKKRFCFLWNNQYFHLDAYEEPCPNSCKGLVLLETYTTLEGDALKLPDFLDIQKEVTEDPAYSMFNLSLKEEMDRK
ncbi:hypothetical protein KUTeg_010271 [Tegillarca granosa]|uniref:NadR/Ttd14 AAA domain-containing protein n=1 Tax=Tegillarca granosa TaxID=220873 RepID=A0ABQ9FB85_TEGGR|nr:hypothetical protein KUTeg_010271 [Tegillarca granosa]